MSRPPPFRAAAPMIRGATARLVCPLVTSRLRSLDAFRAAFETVRARRPGWCSSS